MFDKFIYTAVIIFVFLVSFLASVGAPDIIVEFFRNLIYFVTMTTAMTIALITLSTVLFGSEDRQKNDFLYY